MGEGPGPRAPTAGSRGGGGEARGAARPALTAHRRGSPAERIPWALDEGSRDSPPPLRCRHHRATRAGERPRGPEPPTPRLTLVLGAANVASGPLTSAGGWLGHVLVTSRGRVFPDGVPSLVGFGISLSQERRSCARAMPAATRELDMPQSCGGANVRWKHVRGWESHHPLPPSKKLGWLLPGVG